MAKRLRPTIPQPHVLAALSRHIDDEHGITAQDARWDPYRFRPEHADWPTLHLDDVGGIPFLEDVVGVELYQLRARVRARQGDLVVATCQSMPDYDAYNRDRLLLGDPDFVFAPPLGPPIEVSRAAMVDEPFAQIVDFARRAGRLLIHPYMGIEPVWELAQAVSEAASVPVSVLGPTPAVCWLANDKVRLTQIVGAACGEDYVVPAFVAHDPERLAAGLAELSLLGPQVALKMPRCASAMGNRVFESAAIRAATRDGRIELVRQFLADKQWDGQQELMSVAWEATDCSPSTQLWIPPSGVGPPVLDGVYEQLLVGEQKVFLGSLPSRLGAETDTALGDLSIVVSRVLQTLGYVGRCSFDFIMPADDVIRTVECNGRWGGTSTPMHLLDRLFPDGRPAYRARDYVDKRLVGSSFGALVERLGDALYDARTGRGHLVLYNAGCLPAYGKFDVIAFGDSVSAATEALEVELPALLEGG